MTAAQSELGFNKTGISTAGDLSAEMVEGTREFPPNRPGDEREIALVREDYAKDAEPIGSVPPPPSLKGMMKSGLQAIKGESPTLFIDKLSERLGFERSGVRLYEALISKFDAYGSFTDGPTRADLEHIMSEELQHFRMIHAAILKVGGDPTVMTPSADLHATMSKGIMEVLVDPRTNFVQGLEAILLAELADNDCWHALAQLADQAGEDDLAAQFRQAEMHEREHLVRVRTWLAEAQDRPVTGTAQSTLGGL